MTEKKTSFHQKPCKTNSAEEHNTRAKNLDYVFSDLTISNESFFYDHRKLSAIEKECKEIYLREIGQKMQEKTAPIREGVVVINENTTLNDVKMLAEELGELLQWKPLQVHIHRDEGYMRSKNTEGQRQLNLHAHIIFDCQNKLSGKMNSPKNKLSICQDICARVLRMERGQTSTKKHLDALQWKIQKNMEQIQAQEKIMAENASKLLALKKETDESEKKFFEDFKKNHKWYLEARQLKDNPVEAIAEKIIDIADRGDTNAVLDDIVEEIRHINKNRHSI